MAGRKPKQEIKVDKPLEFSEEPIVNSVTEAARVKKIRPAGNWIKVTPEELASLEQKGLLSGYDPKTQEALIKEIA